MESHGNATFHIGDGAREDELITAQHDTTAANAGQLLEVGIVDTRQYQLIRTLGRQSMLNDL